jgi:hypothetical protein
MSQGSPGSSTLRLEIREGVRVRFYWHLRVWGVIALVSMGLLSQAVPSGLSLPLVWLGYFAAAALVAVATAAASAKLFGKTILLSAAAVEVRRSWRVSTWRLEDMEGTPHLEFSLAGAFYVLVFGYRPSDATRPHRRIVVSLEYFSTADTKALIKALVSTLDDFHIARNRAAFLERQKNR